MNLGSRRVDIGKRLNQNLVRIIVLMHKPKVAICSEELLACGLIVVHEPAVEHSVGHESWTSESTRQMG